MTRMWMIDPSLLCDQHLLGEHKEIHQANGTIKKKMSITGYIENNCIEPKSIKSRHDSLAKEMQRRGMNHKSPLIPSNISYLPEAERNFVINQNHSLHELLQDKRNCKGGNCRKKIINHLFKKYENLMKRRAWSWRYNPACKRDILLDFENLISIAHEVFMDAINRWDWRKGSFCTLLYRSIENRYNTEMEYKKLEIVHIDQKEDYLKDIVEFEGGKNEPCFENRVLFLNSLSNLSPKAQHMIHSVLNTPIELIQNTLTEFGRVRVNKKRLQKYFTEVEGWSIYSTWKTFDEIENALRK